PAGARRCGAPDGLPGTGLPARTRLHPQAGIHQCFRRLRAPARGSARASSTFPDLRPLCADGGTGGQSCRRRPGQRGAPAGLHPADADAGDPRPVCPLRSAMRRTILHRLLWAALAGLGLPALAQPDVGPAEVLPPVVPVLPKEAAPADEPPAMAGPGMAPTLREEEAPASSATDAG